MKCLILLVVVGALLWIARSVLSGRPVSGAAGKTGCVAADASQAPSGETLFERRKKRPVRKVGPFF